MVRVLFVWNTAGASTPVSDWFIRNGYDSTIIMHNDYDAYGMTAGAMSSIMPTTLRSFYESIVNIIKSFRPTHIHVNSNIRTVPIIRATAPYTPVVFQYHGDDVRFRSRIHLEVEYLTDRVIVSTPDLQQYGEVYGCPVHESFVAKGGREEGTALLIIGANAHEDKSDVAKQYCRENDLELTILDCRKGESVPFSQMPKFLSKFEFYFDFKGINALSKKAIEAMACGCKVIPEDMSEILTDYRNTTPEDYLKLYRSVSQPSTILTMARLAIALPWKRWLIGRANG